MLSKILSEEISKRGISNRQAARESGVSHMTIMRIRSGMNIDLTSLKKVAKWLGVSLHNLVAVQSENSNNFEQRLAVLLERNSNLRAEFEELSDFLINGDISSETIEDIVGYANYRIRNRK